jgi:hypothetical protein
MKLTLTLLLSAFLLPSAFASPEMPPPEAGSYSFNGQFTVQMKLHYEIAHAFTQQGQQKLDRLRAEGYECWHKMRGTWLCKQFQATEGATEIVRGRVEKELSGKTLTLGRRFGEPSLISKGTDVAEYKVIQKASYAGREWSEYRLVMSQGNWSIRMGEPTEVQFSLANGGQLSKWEQFPVTESKEAYSVYLVEAAFTKDGNW